MSTSNLKRVKEMIAEGKIPFGINTRIGDPILTDILSSCDFDFIWVEGEHSPVDNRDIFLQIIIIRANGIAPFVRVPWNDPVLLKPILDMGPAAVIIPFVRNADEAKKAVEACKYPPKGIRGWGPIKADNYRSTMTKEEYIEMSRTEPWIILQIEDASGINNIQEIIKVEGVDSVALGPNDLSWSLGHPTQLEHPEVIKHLDRFAEICREEKMPFGTAVSKCSEDDMRKWVERGISWISVGSDQGILINGAKGLINNSRKILDNPD
jgi:2-keto-3-deoxy-L-rhamnonate aldolase RhmA